MANLELTDSQSIYQNFKQQKDQKKNLQQHINLLNSRLNMLKIEDSKKKKQINIKYLKLQQIQSINEQKSQKLYLLKNYQQQEDLRKQHKQNMIYTQRQNQQIMNEKIKSQLSALKYQEKLKIQQQSSINKDQIQQYSKSELKKKIDLSKTIKQEKELSYDKIKLFWDQKINGVNQDKLNLTYKFYQENSHQKKILDNLIQFEQIQLQKLQKSQDKLKTLNSFIDNQQQSPCKTHRQSLNFSVTTLNQNSIG